MFPQDSALLLKSYWDPSSLIAQSAFTCSVSFTNGREDLFSASLSGTAGWIMLMCCCSGQFFSRRGSLQGFVLVNGSNQEGPGPEKELEWFSFLDSGFKSSAWTSHETPVKKDHRRELGFVDNTCAYFHPCLWPFMPKVFAKYSQWPNTAINTHFSLITVGLHRRHLWQFQKNSFAKCKKTSQFLIKKHFWKGTKWLSLQVSLCIERIVTYQQLYIFKKPLCCPKPHGFL